MTEPYYKQHWIDIEPERHAAYDTILAFHRGLEPLLKPLDLRPGLRILDVGSGPAHTTLELARRTAPSGKVTGIDINQEFVARATGHAREQKLNAEFVRGEFPPLPFPDASFDRVFSKNVLEYVDSAAETVAEMARVTAPGGSVVVIDSDWDMLALDMPPGAARERSDRIIAAAKSIAIKEPRIGRRLFALMCEAGLDEVKVDVFAGADTAGRSLTMLRESQSRYARDSGQITARELEQWLADLDRALQCGTYLFVLPQFVARGTKR
ncbi:MAG TPA: methyltransferase domain-containing protein [Candidatus Binataceae bacterium]|nr:methyltransferase domain-containing protein [Candidatus Binataceae bacterium]